MQRPIPISATTAFDGAGVREILAGAGMEATVCLTWDHFRAEVPNTEVGVVVAPWLDQYPLVRLQDFASEHPWYPLVLLTERPPENLRLLARIRVETVLFLGSEEGRLPGVLRATKGGALFLGLARTVRERKDLPYLVRVALARILEEEPPAEPVDASSPKAPPRSIRTLARRLRCSADHLSRLARKHGIDLRSFLAWATALRALQLRINPDVSWERVAWCLGYESVSGLSEHLKTTLGRRPSELDHAELGAWFSTMEERFRLGAHVTRVSGSAVGLSEGRRLVSAGTSRGEDMKTGSAP